MRAGTVCATLLSQAIQSRLPENITSSAQRLRQVLPILDTNGPDSEGWNIVGTRHTLPSTL